MRCTRETRRAEFSSYGAQSTGSAISQIRSPREGEEKPENWVRRLWQITLEEEHGIAHKTLAWFTYPAVPQVSASKPKYFKQCLRRYEDMTYDVRIKPFGFVLSAQVAPASYPE
jgi:hypothetical protein